MRVLAFAVAALFLQCACADDAAAKKDEQCDSKKGKEEPFQLKFCADTCESLKPKYAKDSVKDECKGTARKVSSKLNILDAFKSPQATETAEDKESFKRRVFVQLNGENDGFWFSYMPGCAGALARAAAKAHGAKGEDLTVGKRLYTAMGCPLRDMSRKQFTDIECSDRVLHLLYHLETWVWPGVHTGYSWYTDGSKMTTKSLIPKVIFVENILSPEQADFIIEKGKPHLQGSPEQHYSPGFEGYRTSDSAFFTDRDEGVPQDVRSRSALLARLPQAYYCENIQLVRYKPGQWYKQHQDYFHGWRFPDGKKPKKKVIVPNRHVTVFLYLNDDFKGGETVFPHAEHNAVQFHPQRKGMPECSHGLAVKPVKGAAALFYSKKGNGRTQKLSSHGGCPPEEGGIKYGGNVFCWDMDSDEGYSAWRHIL